MVRRRRQEKDTHTRGRWEEEWTALTRHCFGRALMCGRRGELHVGRWKAIALTGVERLKQNRFTLYHFCAHRPLTQPMTNMHDAPTSVAPMELSPVVRTRKNTRNYSALQCRIWPLLLKQDLIDDDMNTVGQEPRMIVHWQCPELHGPPIARHDESQAVRPNLVRVHVRCGGS